MATMRVTIPLRKDGRIVIPQPIRDELALDYGDLVEVELRTINKTDVIDTS